MKIIILHLWDGEAFFFTIFPLPLIFERKLQFVIGCSKTVLLQEMLCHIASGYWLLWYHKHTLNVAVWIHLAFMSLHQWMVQRLGHIIARTNVNKQSQPMLIYHQLDTQGLISINFCSQFKNFHPRQPIWKHSQKIVPLIQASIHRNKNVIILMKFSLLAALKVVKNDNFQCSQWWKHLCFSDMLIGGGVSMQPPPYGKRQSFLRCLYIGHQGSEIRLPCSVYWIRGPDVLIYFSQGGLETMVMLDFRSHFWSSFHAF